ncbi:hypothetical protein AHF37_03248, partial [Paragonimus kellicotti]
LPTVLVEGLAQTRHPILRVSSVKALSDVGNRFRQFHSPLTPESSSPDVCMTQHLSTLVAGVVDCLSTFGEPILDDGLYALHNLLRVDPAGFTMSAQSQVTVVLVDLFKHCINVLVEGLAQTRHPILRVSSVKALSDVGNRFRQFHSPLTPESSSPDVCMTQHLSTLVAGVVDCLSTFGEPILDDGLYALHNLLRVDPAGFTMSAQSQVTVVLVDLFKHCINGGFPCNIWFRL